MYINNTMMYSENNNYLMTKSHRKFCEDHVLELSIEQFLKQVETKAFCLKNNAATYANWHY